MPAHTGGLLSIGNIIKTGKLHLFMPIHLERSMQRNNKIYFIIG
jgi:hypothetical protein